MGNSIFSAPHFHNEEAAYRFVEARVWPKGPVCPHCGGVERIGKMGGNSTRIGVHKCYDCRKPFTVKVGTIFESSHISLQLWLQAIFLIASSKKGISSNQLHRTLGVTLKTAWFLGHRIREAMRLASMTPMGQGGNGVDIDEIYIGTDKSKPRPKHGPAQEHKMLSLIDRTSGRARSMVIDNLKSKTIIPIMRTNVAHEAHVMTDSARYYSPLEVAFREYDKVDHKLGEYVRMSDRSVHTNTVEGFFSIFNRGMKGVYQHCDKQHLQRYLAQFDFRCLSVHGLASMTRSAPTSC